MLKKVIFSLVTVLIFFGVIEVLLRCFSIADPSARPDPLAGFEGSKHHIYEQAVAKDGNPIYRTTDSAIAQKFHVSKFDQMKKPGTFRIFALGESTVWGSGVQGQEGAFTRWLGDYLAAMIPDKNFEIINSAIPGYGSTRIRILMNEIITYQPDLIIIVMGHNEYLERRFWVVEHMPNPRMIQFQQFLNHSRIYLLMTDMIAGIKNRWKPRSAEKEDRLSDELLKKLQDAVEITKEELMPVPEDADVEKKINMIGWQTNLQAIIDLANKSGIPLIFGAPASNLLTEPVVYHYSGGPTARKQLLLAIQTAKKALSEDHIDAAIQSVEHAKELSADDPWIDYLSGKIQIHQGDFANARHSLENALEKDAKAHRMKPSLRKIMRTVSEKNNIRFIDFHELFQQSSDIFNIMSENAFVDYCHPTVEGHKLMAWALLPLIAKELKLPEVDPQLTWGYTGLTQTQSP